MAKCKLCGKPYSGKTTRMLRNRTGEHRRAFYRILDGKSYDESDDTYSIGAHLYHKHGLDDRSAFNSHVSFCILENASPNNLDVKEHKHIHKIRSLRPLGLNTTNPFKIPVLDKD